MHDTLCTHLCASWTTGATMPCFPGFFFLFLRFSLYHTRCILVTAAPLGTTATTSGVLYNVLMMYSSTGHLRTNNKKTSNKKGGLRVTGKKEIWELLYTGFSVERPHS